MDGSQFRRVHQKLSGWLKGEAPSHAYPFSFLAGVTVEAAGTGSFGVSPPSVPKLSNRASSVVLAQQYQGPTLSPPLPDNPHPPSTLCPHAGVFLLPQCQFGGHSLHVSFATRRATGVFRLPQILWRALTPRARQPAAAGHIMRWVGEYGGIY